MPFIKRKCWKIREFYFRYLPNPLILLVFVSVILLIYKFAYDITVSHDKNYQWIENNRNISYFFG